MQTSASITNSTVSTRSLADRPKRMRGGAAAAAGGSISWRVSSNLPSSPAQPLDDAPHRRVCGSGREKGHCGAFVDLPEGRIRGHHLGHGANIEALTDGERPRRNQLAGVRPHDGGAKYAAARARHDLDVTVRHPFGLGPVILAVWPAHHANSISLIACLL